MFRFQNSFCTSNVSPWIFAALLVTTFLIFDAYHSHLLPFPWSPDNAENPQPDLDNDAANYSHADTNQFNTVRAPPANTTLSTSQSVASSKNSTSAVPPASSTIDSLQTVSLRKLEAGLRRARWALRKIALENNTTPQASFTKETEDYIDPSGACYRDAAIFRQSYLEMEKRFRVFVYPEGEEPLVHNGPCKEIYSVEGRFIQELQGNNAFVTSDPEKAHVFFLPFSVSMMVSYLYIPQSFDMKPLRHFVRDYVDVVASKYPFWNRSNGADHFMLSCHDWGPDVSKAHPDLQNNAIRVLCNANKSEGFLPVKDASLPEINLVGGYTQAELGGPSFEERTHLAFFAGRNHGPVRPILYKYWEGKDNDVRVFQELPKEYSYQDFLKKSKFCLCPSGYEVNSPRLVEAIYNDCVPVVIRDDFVLPFSDVLDWKSFSVQVMERDIPELKKILQAVPKARYNALQEGVRQVRRHFLLNQPPKRYDAFHMILHSIWLRRLNIRISY